MDLGLEKSFSIEKISNEDGNFVETRWIKARISCRFKLIMILSKFIKVTIQSKN